MTNHPSAAAERVLLRAPTPSDRDELALLGAASRTLHHPWPTAPATSAAVDEWLDQMKSDRSATFVACQAESRAIVGVFSLSEIVRGAFQSSHAVYYVHAAYSGNGYMTEGLRLLLRHAFGPLGLADHERWAITREDQRSITAPITTGDMSGYRPVLFVPARGTALQPRSPLVRRPRP